MAVTLVPNDEKKSKSDNKREGNPIGKFTLAEVDSSLAEYEKVIKGHSDIVKHKLASGAPIPSNILRELSRANTQKSRLTMRRISLLVESGDAQVSELLEKLMKIKPQKVGAHTN